MQIGAMTIAAMKGMASEQLDAYAKKINEAFLKSDDGKLKVTLALDVSVSEEKANSLDVDATISFTADKVKDKVSKTISESQSNLFDAVEKMRPEKGSSVESVTLSSGGKSITLAQKA